MRKFKYLVLMAIMLVCSTPISALFLSDKMINTPAYMLKAGAGLWLVIMTGISATQAVDRSYTAFTAVNEIKKNKNFTEAGQYSLIALTGLLLLSELF